MQSAASSLRQVQAVPPQPLHERVLPVHYDNKNSDSTSTIVLGKTCYLKMAENHPQYDGFEAGVIVLTADGQLLNREGSIVYDGNGGETLLGGWAKAYRKDRSRPLLRGSEAEASTTPRNPCG